MGEALMLRGLDLSAADLSSLELQGVTVEDLTVDDVNLSNSDLAQADLRGLRLNEGKRLNLSSADLSDADLRGVKLPQSPLCRCLCHGSPHLTEYLDADILPQNPFAIRRRRGAHTRWYLVS